MSAKTSSLAGLRVAAFESRRADDMARLIERHGGLARVSPSMRETPLVDNPAAVDFAHRVLTGQVDIIVFMTGVGVRYLMAEVDGRVDRARLLDSISDVTTIARGPKPVAVLKELGLKPTFRVPPPNTWREVLATIDQSVPVAQQNVAVQEYGTPNASLVAGIEARGGRVETVSVYRWDLPLDLKPLEANIRAIVAGEIDVALFTSSHQAVNLLRVAEGLGQTDLLRKRMAELVVASIGPTTSETLRELELPVDIEPEHNKMGSLVVAAAEQASDLLARKRRRTNVWAGYERPAAPAPDAASEPGGGTPIAHDSLFMRACRREPVPRTPIWLMRQAGRYLPEYRAIRSRTTFLELCKNPRLSAQVMLDSVARLGVDAAIIFSDLLPILEPMGFDLEFAQGEGPLIHNPVREVADLKRVGELETLDALEFVFETVRQTRAGLPANLPVIGFAGAPFTLASYAVEGAGSRNYHHTKALMYRDPSAWDALAGRLTRAVARYLNAQIAAGAQAVQLFDSWVGCLGVADYRRYVAPYSKAVIDALTPGVPVIHFAAGNPALLPAVAEAGGSVIGVDWRVDLEDAWRTIGRGRAVQGNLDPCLLLAEPAEIRRRAEELLRRVGGRPGHIFNLGHGVLPNTPVENVLALIEAVKGFELDAAEPNRTD